MSPPMRLTQTQKRSIYLSGDGVAAINLHDCASTAGRIKAPLGWTVPYDPKHVRWKKGQHPEVMTAGSV